MNHYKKLNIVYMGTPDFSIPALELLLHHPNVNVVEVISMPDRPSGRKQQLHHPPLIEFAKKNKISTFQTENINQEKEHLTQLKKKNIDAIIVLAFAQFLGDEILNLPQFGCFNIHTSLLPKYRGAAPIQFALLNNDKTTGVSIQKMVKKMDAGNIVSKLETSIAPNETGGQLTTRLKFLAALCLNDFLNKLMTNNISEEIQDESHVSFAKTLKREDGYLDFEHLRFEEACNKIRALDPWPGTYCFVNHKRLKVFQLAPADYNLKAGELKSHMGQLLIGLSDKTARIVELQYEGKKRGSDKDLLNGMREELQITAQ